MIIERVDALRSWLVKTLGPICDADPDILAKYVLALIKKDKPVEDLITKCRNELDIFLQDKCAEFVNKLFMVLKSGEFGNWSATKPRQAVTSTSSAAAVSTGGVLKAKNQSYAEPVSSSGVALEGGDIHGQKYSMVEPVGSDGGLVRGGEYRSSGSGGAFDGKDAHRKRKLSPCPPSPRRRSPSPRGSQTQSRRSPPRVLYDDRLHRRQNADTSSSRYSPSRRRSRSGSRSDARSRPLTRRRSRSWSSGSSRSGSASSASHPKRLKRTGGRRSADKNVANRPTVSTRCQDYEERGFCVRGDLCPYDHGSDPVVLDDVSLGLQAASHEFASSLPPPPGVSTLIIPPGLPNMAPRPDVPFHPGHPSAPYLHPPQHGTVIYPPGVLPVRTVPPPPHAIEPYMPEPFAPQLPKMSVFQQQMMAPPPAAPGYTMAPNQPPAPVPTTSSGQWVASGGQKQGYGVVPQSHLTYTNVPTSRHGNLVVVPTMQDTSTKSTGKIKVSEFVELPAPAVKTSSQILQELMDKRAMPVTESAGNTAPGATSSAGGAAAGKKPTASFEWQRHTASGAPWNNKSKNVTNATLELRRVPPEMNNIAKINEHFARFGTLVNLQVAYNGDPEAALVSFASHAQASAAYYCSEPMFNNRFIKIFWHNPDNANQSGAGGRTGPQQQVTSMTKPVEPEKRSYPPAHQLQLNNKRSIVTTSVSTVVPTIARTESLMITITKPSLAPAVTAATAPTTSLDSETTSPNDEQQKLAALVGLTSNPIGMAMGGGSSSGGGDHSAAGSSSAASVYMPPRPGSMKLNSRDQMKKEAMKKRLELQKQKQSLLERQIEQQKLLLGRLDKNKKMSAEDKASIVDTIKKLAASIDKLKTELSTAVSRLPAATGHRYVASGFAASRTPAALSSVGDRSAAGRTTASGAILVCPTKLVRNVKAAAAPAAAAVGASSTPPVAPVKTASTATVAATTTSAATIAKADGVEPTDSLPTEVAEKRVSESEPAVPDATVAVAPVATAVPATAAVIPPTVPPAPVVVPTVVPTPASTLAPATSTAVPVGSATDLPTTTVDNTSLLRQRVAALKREAASLGLLGGPGTPLGRGSRGRGLRRGFAGPLANRTFDRRPRQLMVTGFMADDKEDVLTHLMTYGAVDSSIIDTLAPSISIKYKTRQSAENAVAQGTVYKGQQLSMAWQSADGILSPKIRPPSPSTMPQLRSPTSRTHRISGSGGGVDARTSVSSSGEPRKMDAEEEVKTTVSKLLQDEDDEDDDELLNDDPLLLGGDDDDDDDDEDSRSWRR